MDRNDPAYNGQREYTPLFLRVYDPVILGLLAPVVWRCPAARLVEGYRRHARNRHLDVGPGTGYFLERAGLPDGSPVTLLDPNANVLGHASRRLRNLDIKTVEADVLKPLPVEGPFDSAALNGVLHCLPGPLPGKAAAVANVAAALAPGGVLFGSSILGDSGRHTWLGRRILEANNRRGTFDNLGDTEEGLRAILEASFEQVELDTVGSMAIFAATHPRRSPAGSEHALSAAVFDPSCAAWPNRPIRNRSPRARMRPASSPSPAQLAAHWLGRPVRQSRRPSTFRVRSAPWRSMTKTSCGSRGS